jgi:regulatory helix-turn-helix LysR family protein
MGRMSCPVRDGAYLTRQLARYSGRDHCGRRIGRTLYVHKTPWPGTLPLPMADIDLNLLTSLDALLAEGSVVGAARRLGLSASAMSRTLARLRTATGDPLLVRAGRGLVPTPHATELRERVRDLAQGAQAVLRPAVTSLDLADLKRTFTIRSNEGFVEVFAAHLVTAVTAVAPNVRLHFAPKPRQGRPSAARGVGRS